MTTTAAPVLDAPLGGAPAGEPAAIAGRTPFQLFWERLKEDRVALVALGFIVLEVLIAILAPWIVKLFGHPPNAQFPDELDPTTGRRQAPPVSSCSA